MLMRELVQVAKPDLSSTDKQQQYYDLLKQGVEKEDIIDVLFDNAPTAEQNLRQLKFTLENKLVSDFISQSNKTGNQALDTASIAYKYYAAGKLMLARQFQEGGAELLEKAYRYARKGQIISIALDCAKTLATYFSNIEGDFKKFSYYQESLNELFELQQKETIAQSYFNEISFHFKHKWNDNIAAKAFTYCTLTAPTIYTSVRTAIFHFQTLTLAYISDLDFEGLIKCCEEAFDHFSNIEHPPKSVVTIFKVKQATGYIHLGQYEKAINCLDEVIAIADKGKYSYCTAFFYKGITGLHANDIKLANEALKAVQPYIDNLPGNFQEQWKILQAYIALFSSEKFKIGKFLNEVPIFEKDKAGGNAAIIIVQLLHYLKKDHTSSYIEYSDALARYTSRYLSGKMKILAKLLLEVPKGHFKRSTIELRTKRLVKKLNTESRELEIIPAQTGMGDGFGFY